MIAGAFDSGLFSDLDIVKLMPTIIFEASFLAVNLSY